MFDISLIMLLVSWDGLLFMLGCSRYSILINDIRIVVIIFLLVFVVLLVIVVLVLMINVIYIGDM